MVSQVIRQLHVVRDDEVAEGAVAPVIAFPAQPDFRSALRQRLYFQLQLLSAGQLDDDLASQKSGVEIDADVGLHLPRRLLPVCPPGAGSCRPAPASATEQILEEAAESAPAASEAAEVESAERISASLSAALLSLESAESAGLFIGFGIAPLFTVLVVLGTFLWIADDLERLAERLELGLCFRIVGVKVRVELLCTFPVGCPYILLRDVPVYAQNLIVVYKCHNSSSLIVVSYIVKTAKNVPLIHSVPIILIAIFTQHLQFVVNVEQGDGGMADAVEHGGLDRRVVKHVFKDDVLSCLQGMVECP